MKLDPNAPAYPVLSMDSWGKPHVSCGITVRQDFAKAMAQQMCSLDHEVSYEKVAEMSVNQADALISELNKEKANDV